MFCYKSYSFGGLVYKKKIKKFYRNLILNNFRLTGFVDFFWNPQRERNNRKQHEEYKQSGYFDSQYNALAVLAVGGALVQNLRILDERDDNLAVRRAQ